MNARVERGSALRARHRQLLLRSLFYFLFSFLFFSAFFFFSFIFFFYLLILFLFLFSTIYIHPATDISTVLFAAALALRQRKLTWKERRRNFEETILPRLNSIRGRSDLRPATWDIQSGGGFQFSHVPIFMSLILIDIIVRCALRWYLFLLIICLFSFWILKLWNG